MANFRIYIVYVLTGMCVLIFQLVIGQVLTFVVQLSQHKLVRAAVSYMVCVLLYHDVSHTASHPPVSGVA